MTARTFAILACALVLVVPVAGATHWTLYYSGIDPSAGATREDDARVVQASGNPLDGRANRVAPAGRVPGDGSMFLDSRLGIFAGATIFTDAALDRATLLLPGESVLAAWYGTWLDIDDDGVIRDVHDAECGDAPCPEDEFIWHGIGSGAFDEAMIAYEIPGYTDTLLGGDALVTPPLLAGYRNASTYGYSEFDDRTAHEHAEQGWIGRTAINVDEGFLSTIQVVTLAGAQRAFGSDFVYDLDDPRALLDVDAYEAVSPDVETLYVSARATQSALGAPIAAVMWPLVATPVPPEALQLARVALDNVTALRALVNEIAADPATPARELAADPSAPLRRLYTPKDAKEPNTELDDYGGRAFFGGMGDALGSHNTYDEYASAYHFYFDNVARFGACAGAYGRVPTTSTEAAVVASCQAVSKTDPVELRNADPFGTQFAKARTASTSLMFHGYLFVWSDLNGDSHVGEVCDPSDPEEFDAERNTCKRAPEPWPHVPGELYDVCATARAKGASFTLTPMSGTWDGVIVVRHVRESTRVAYEPATWEFPTGSDPISITWYDECTRYFNQAPAVHSRDALIFTSGGNQMPILVRAEVSLAGYKDVDLGVDVGEERVIDYDILPAAL